MPSYKFEARVKANSQTAIITAFAGREYTKKDWRPVPADTKSEAQAQTHPFLEVRAVGKIPVVELAVVQDAAIEQPDQKKPAPKKPTSKQAGDK